MAHRTYSDPRIGPEIVMIGQPPPHNELVRMISALRPKQINRLLTHVNIMLESKAEEDIGMSYLDAFVDARRRQGNNEPVTITLWGDTLAPLLQNTLERLNIPYRTVEYNFGTPTPRKTTWASLANMPPEERVKTFYNLSQRQQKNLLKDLTSARRRLVRGDELSQPEKLATLLDAGYRRNVPTRSQLIRAGHNFYMGDEFIPIKPEDIAPHDRGVLAQVAQVAPSVIRRDQYIEEIERKVPVKDVAKLIYSYTQPAIPSRRRLYGLPAISQPVTYTSIPAKGPRKPRKARMTIKPKRKPKRKTKSHKKK